MMAFRKGVGSKSNSKVILQDMNSLKDKAKRADIKAAMKRNQPTAIRIGDMIGKWKRQVKEKDLDPCLILPSNEVKLNWDFFITALLIYSCLVTTL